MSNFEGKIIHPKTGKKELAKFIDDYFGRHQYGVKFADGEVFRLEELWPLNKE